MGSGWVLPGFGSDLRGKTWLGSYLNIFYLFFDIKVNIIDSTLVIKNYRKSSMIDGLCIGQRNTLRILPAQRQYYSG